MDKKQELGILLMKHYGTSKHGALNEIHELYTGKPCKLYKNALICETGQDCEHCDFLIYTMNKDFKLATANDGYPKRNRTLENGEPSDNSHPSFHHSRNILKG